MGACCDKLNDERAEWGNGRKYRGLKPNIDPDLFKKYKDNIKYIIKLQSWIRGFIARK